MAAVIMAELISGRRWDHAFANSRAGMDQLADEALEEFRDGRTGLLDPEGQDFQRNKE